MKLETPDFQHGSPMPVKFAFGRIDPDSHIALADNYNPTLRWSEVPDGVKSFALLCVDPDVPSKADDVNQEGRTVSSDLPRVDFYHWVMVDLPASLREIPAGQCSEGVTPRGKQQPAGPEGARQGLNDFTDFLAGDENMAGKYFGYDGPCPPWNDELVHHYHFRLYALDVDSLPVAGEFRGKEVEQAMQGHVLAEASIMGTYTLNPSLVGG